MKLAVIMAAALAVSCTPAQQQTVATDATKAGPVIYGTCSLVEAGVDAFDPMLGPGVAIACTAAEDIDGALMKLAAQGVTQVRIVCPLRVMRDGGSNG